MQRLTPYYLLSIIGVILYFWIYIVIYWMSVKGDIPNLVELHRYTIYLVSILMMCLIIMEPIINKKIDYFDGLFISFIIYLLLILNLNYYLVGDIYDFNGVSVNKYNFYLILQYVVCFFIGKYFLFGHSRRKLDMVILGHIICALILFKYKSETNILIDITDVPHGQQGIYLFSSDYLAIFSLWLISYFKEKRVVILLSSCCFLLMFCFLSRSACIFFLCSILIVYGFKYKVQLTMFSIFLLSGFSANIDYLTQEYPRMFFFLNYQSDSSFLGREIQKEVGYRAILDNPIFGDYAGQITSLNYVGEYIHNIMSYWRQFGLTGFLFVLLLTIFIPVYFFLKNKLISTEGDKIFVFLLFLFIVFQILLSRSFAWPMLFIFIGVFSAYKKNEKYDISCVGKTI